MPEQVKHPPSDTISTSLVQNITYLHSQFSQTPDLVVRHFFIMQSGDQAALVYLSGLVDKNTINNNVLRSLQFEKGYSSALDDITVNVGEVER